MAIAFAGCTGPAVGHRRGKETETSGMAVAPKRPAAPPAISTRSPVSCAMAIRTAQAAGGAEAIAFRLRLASSREVKMAKIQRIIVPDLPPPVSHYCHVTRAGSHVW